MAKYIVTISGDSIREFSFESNSRDSKRHLDAYIANECVVTNKSGKIVSAARKDCNDKSYNIYIG